MEQQVKELQISDLVLWTENPRDPINPKATDQEIVNKALNGSRSKWTLDKLAKEMGAFYDFSELPTVVYKDNKPIVYDGNRRMILAKIKHGLVSIPNGTELSLPEIPKKIPCNVCSEKIALINVFRKHSDSGSWQPLERDIFLHHFMGEEKSTFYILEEDTQIISSNPHLNQRFVKEEIFKPEILNDLGFDIRNGKLFSVHDNTQARSILTDISAKIANKEISTRHNRGKVIEVLDPENQKLIEQNKDNKLRKAIIKFNSNIRTTDLRQSKRSSINKNELFGGKLFLRIGEVSDLYRDISDLYHYYLKYKNTLSASFPSLIRMSLRLLCESAAKDANKKLDKYLTEHYTVAKKSVDQDVKTMLSNHNVNEKSIIQLLHTGAHHYTASNNIEQTIALSIIIGAIISLTHGKA